LSPFLLRERVQRKRLRHAVRPDGLAAERRQVRTDAERLADVVGEGANVGAFGAMHEEVHVVASPAGPLEAVAGHRPRLHRHVLTAPGLPVEPLATALDGRIQRRALLDLTEEPRADG